MGTTFRICLPQHKETNAQAAQSDAPGAVHGNETVLLVEDEPAILNLTRQILEHLGYRVLATHSPEAAIRLARNSTARIDLLLTDVIMPGMNGRDLAKELAKNHSNLSCLFMSGYTADAISPHGIMDDGVHFLQKPFTIKDLARKVREALQTPHL